ncbi:MAG: T9SS type A sorting domain-containing protein [Bacteroidales bacterium]|nr:T9SS type A sorting domain-containing protein [Bacteroidales bacterium]
MRTTRLYTLFALLLMAGGVTMKAQEYLPIAQKGNEWHTFETGVWQINNYVNWCSGDTLIGNVRYMKIMGTVNDSYPIFYTLLREEDGKVWKRYSIAHPETLLYDFTASVGDTLRIGDFAEEMVLDSISMVQIGDVDRRKFWFGLEYDDMGKPRAKETWVEGVGSDYGLLWSGYYGVPDGWHCLLCFHQYGELVWQNPEYNTCTYPYDAVNENKDSEISIYPNPVGDRVIIEGIEVAEVEVYNALGQRVRTVRSTNEINVSGLQEGVYLLFITDAKGISQTKRITVIR